MAVMTIHIKDLTGKRTADILREQAHSTRHMEGEEERTPCPLQVFISHVYIREKSRIRCNSSGGINQEGYLWTFAVIPPIIL